MLLAFVFGLFLSAHGQPLASEWKPAPIPGADSAWVNEKAPSQTITVVKHTSKYPLSFGKATNRQIASGIAFMRESTLNYLGFSNFTLKHFTVERLGPTTVVHMAGSYRRPDGVAIQFIERQNYRGKQFVQFSYLEKSLAPIRTPEKIEKILKGISDASQRSPASESTEPDSGVCLGCESVDPFAQLTKEAKDVTAITEKQMCQDKKTILIDPKMRSVLQELKLDYDGSDPITVASRSALTCIYGALAGAVTSVKDLVMLIPKLLGLIYDGGVGLAKMATSADYEALARKFTIQNVKDGVSSAFSITINSVKDAWDYAAKAYEDSSTFVGEAYREGGVAGAVAAVGQAAYESSPHRILGRQLVELATKVAQAVADEWRGFRCLPAEVASQMVCSVIGYLAVDIYTGKLLITALSKPGKLMEYVNKFLAKYYKSEGGAVTEVASAERRGASLPNSGNASADAFTAREGATPGFIAEVNQGAGIPLTSESSGPIARALKSDPSNVQEYGDVMRSVNQMKTESAAATTGAEQGARLKEVSAHAEDIVKKLNLSLVQDGARKLNVKYIAEVLREAQTTQKPDTLIKVKRALEEIEEARRSSGGDMKKAIKSWREQIAKDRPHVTEAELKMAEECLFTSAAK